MADATFDYVNLVITLPSGQTEVDVERDLYSAWKRSQAADEEPETGAYPAFRTIGGDPLTPGIDAGAYFFIRNDLGWRIKPAEEDATVLVTGNLAPEDSSVPILIPTTGDFQVLVAGLQPITQSVATLLELQQSSSYAGYVVLDTVGGVAGTSYPIGQHQQPVNNLTDALAIMAANGLETLIVHGNLTLDQTIPERYNLRGNAGTEQTILTLNGQTVDKVHFSQMYLVGAGVGEIQAEFCDLDNLSGVTGTFRQCGFANTMTLTTGSYVMTYCYSEIAGTNKPVLDFNGALADVSIRAYSGGLDVRNITNAGATMTIDVISASILFAASNTAGSVVIRGVGDYTDNSVGMTLTNQGFLEGGQLFTDVLDEPNSIETGLTMREALRLILAATAGKVSGGATSTITFRNAVSDTKDRIVATVDSNGNRTALTYDVSD